MELSGRTAAVAPAAKGLLGPRTGLPVGSDDAFYVGLNHELADKGYIAICPDLFWRQEPGVDLPHWTEAEWRNGIALYSAHDFDAGVSDVADTVATARTLDGASGKVGVMGTCSGGRQTFLFACQTKEIDAAVELWGGRVVMSKEELTPKQPTAPIEFTKSLSCPLLGLFGNEDRSPTPEQVNQHEAELKKHGKQYEFHRYDGAGHGFFYYDRPMYRLEQALDGWQKVFAFLPKHLAK